MALQSSKNAKMTLTNEVFTQNQVTKTEYEYENDDIDEDADNWKTIKYHTSFILKESELLKGTINIELALNKDKSISGTCSKTKVNEVPLLLRCQAEI